MCTGQNFPCRFLLKSSSWTTARLTEPPPSYGDWKDRTSSRFAPRDKTGGKAAPSVKVLISSVTGEIVLIQDADLEYAVEDYEALLRPIVCGTASAVYGSRFLGRIEGMRWVNRIFNHILCWAVWLLFGRRITDEATAYKVVRTDLLRAMSLESRRFEICTGNYGEIDAHEHRYP